MSRWLCTEHVGINTSGPRECAAHMAMEVWADGDLVASIALHEYRTLPDEFRYRHWFLPALGAYMRRRVENRQAREAAA